MEPILLYITTANREEGILLCEELLASHLIACGNIIENASSLYYWQGEIERNTEALLIAKTLKYCLERVIERVNNLHSYDCPCVIALPIIGGNPEYIEWIGQQVMVNQ